MPALLQELLVQNQAFKEFETISTICCSLCQSIHNNNVSATDTGFNVLEYSICPPRRGELRTQKLKPHLVRTLSLNVLPLKLRVGQCIAIHATLTARDFFLAYFYPSDPFTCIFFQNLSRFFLCLLCLTHGSCVGPQNKIGHPAGGRFPC